LGLTNVSVQVERAERLRVRGDVVLARAVWDAPELWKVGEPLLGPGGRILYFAGATWPETEARALSEAGAMVSVCSPSTLAHEGTVVMMTRGQAPGGEGR